jgi:hypothetical protein
VTVGTVCQSPAAVRRVSPSAEQVAYANDPKRDLSATPLTPLGDVDGVADRSRILSMA